MALISDPGVTVSPWENDPLVAFSPENGFFPFAAEPDIFMGEADTLDPNIPDGILIGIGDAFLEDPGYPDVPPTELSAPEDGFDALPLLALSIGSFDFEEAVGPVAFPDGSITLNYYYWNQNN